MLLLTTKLINRFSYYITTHFIPSNKDYNSCRNLHLVYQTYSKIKVKNCVYRIPQSFSVTVLFSNVVAK